MAIDAAWFASVDPATLLFTDATVDAVLRPEAPHFLSDELMGDDVNKFVQLARSPVAVRALGQATALHWGQSRRHRCNRLVACAAVAHDGDCGRNFAG